MSELTAQTLIRAVQAVNAEVSRILAQRDRASDPELSQLEELLTSYSKAEMELNAAYEAEQSSSDNLPPYSELID